MVCDKCLSRWNERLRSESGHCGRSSFGANLTTLRKARRSKPKLTQDNRQTGLDFLRVAACFLVIFHHFSQRLRAEDISQGGRLGYAFFSYGSFGVAIFFVLSGYLLALPFWRAHDSANPFPSLREYTIRRASRIVPGYYVAIGATLLVSALLLGEAPSAAVLLRALSGLTFLNSFHPVTFFPIDADAPLWSIGMEVISYCLLPIAMWLVFRLPGRSRIASRLGFALVLCAVLELHRAVSASWPFGTIPDGWKFGFVDLASHWMPGYHPLSFFLIFGLGALSASLSILVKSRSVIADILSVIALLAAAKIMLDVGVADGEGFWGFQNIPFAFPLFPLLVATAVGALPHARYLPVLTERRPVRFLASISFGMYLFHSQAIDVAQRYVFPFFVNGQKFSEGQYFTACVSIIALVLVIASLSWFLVERPLLRLAGRYLGARASVTPVARPSIVA